MKPLHYYFIGTGCWFVSYGIQSVIFAWLVTIVLRESPNMMGIAQMTLLLPTTFLLLIGGSLADHFGGKPIAILAQVFAAFCVFFLMVVIHFDQFSYSALLLFAFAMGCAQALVTPARDGLLALVAEGRIQRTVLKVTLIQFGVQMLGFLIASFADSAGAVIVLGFQMASLLLGAVALQRIQIPAHTRGSPDHPSFRHLLLSIKAGIVTVRQSPSMSTVVMMNCAMAVFFMGSYMVTVPLLIREVYGGTSAQLSGVNTANGIGLMLMVLYLLRLGYIRRQGRALILAHAAGAIALATASLGLGFGALIVSLGCWGMSGGAAVTMSRTIMQEQAPPDQRARVMALFSLSFMGAGPLGALYCGMMVQWLGPETTLLVNATAMFIVVTLITAKSSLWQLDSGVSDG